MAVVAGVSIPQVTVGMDRARAGAAARYLAARMTMARTEAVSRAAAVALRFREDSRGMVVASFVDGNGNGVRTSDIDAAVDLPLEPPVRLEDRFPGVTIGTPAGSVDAPVLLGGTELLSFMPGGTASSGTVHVLGRDGSRFAVRVLGVTGRVRVLRLDPSGSWVEWR
jgi:hypothetical protein